MVIVDVQQGTLKGAVNTYEGVEYISFKGIPYAQPPVGSLRFKAPEPPSGWDGVRDALDHRAVCPQFNERLNRLETGSEDCLYLNVYTKNLKPQQLAPVMVWIHGGAFYTGSGNSDFYGPEFIVSDDIVLVTFNYRLDIFGFLCLGTEDIPGNAGLKDQVAALKWVNHNIAAFGGDCNNVTIFGCSAGSASVSYHLLSDMSKGLYNKAICQSGVCLNEWSYNIHHRERAIQLAQFLGLKTENMHELQEFLKEVPTMSLVNIKLPPIETKIKDLCDHIVFGPVIENENLSCQHFLTESPPDLLRTGKLAKVPIMLGYTSSEGIEIARDFPNSLKYRLYCIEYNIPRELKYIWPSEKVQDVAHMVIEYYIKDKEDNDRSLQDVVNLSTDLFFAYNIRRFARYAKQLTNNPVYMYKFDLESERNYTKRYYKMESVKGVCHTDDLPYLFNITCLDIPLTTESKPMVQRVTSLWTHFARNSNPNYTDALEEWKEFTEDKENCYIIGHECNNIQHPDADRMQLWDTIYGDKQVPLDMP